MKFVKFNYSFLADFFFKLPKWQQLQENIYIFTKLLQMPLSLIFGCKCLNTFSVPFTLWKKTPKPPTTK